MSNAKTPGGYLIQHRQIDPLYGCWLFTGYINKEGYGQFTWKGNVLLAHRIAYELFVKKPEKDVLHKLECPNKHCFNPYHLYEGDDKNNYLDREIFDLNHGLREHNQEKQARTHCPQGHEYTEENTYIYNNCRGCKICRKARSTASMKAHKK